GLPALTWSWLVSHLWINLTGRNGVVGTMSLLATCGIPLLWLFVLWLSSHPESRAALIAAAPWALGVALLLKLLAGALVVWGLRRRRLVAGRALARLGVAWVAAALGIVALSLWLTPAELVSPWAVACGAVLLLPLVRLGLAPLALDWNRHR